MRLKLYHWSNQPNLKILDPKFHGTGIKGAEAKRKAQFPQYYVNRIYYGTGKYEKEVGLGSYRYSVVVDTNKLYNLAKDKDDFAAKARDEWGNFNISKAEKIIKNAGYLGVFNPDYDVVAIFQPLIPIKKEVLR